MIYWCPRHGSYPVVIRNFASRLKVESSVSRPKSGSTSRSPRKTGSVATLDYQIRQAAIARLPVSRRVLSTAAFDRAITKNVAAAKGTLVPASRREALFATDVREPPLLARTRGVRR